MKFELDLQLEKSAKKDTLVLFTTQKAKGKDIVVHIPNAALSKYLSAAIEDKTVTGKPAELATFRDIHFEGYRHVVLVGLGKSHGQECMRQATSCVIAALRALRTLSVAIDVDSAISGKKEAGAMIQALTEGLILSNYDHDHYVSKKEDLKKSKISILTKFIDASTKKSFEAGQIIAETINFSRKLGDTPGNYMNPELLGEAAIQQSKGTGIKATVWDKARIKKEKMGGLYGVGHGSEHEPKFIILEYKGAAASKKPVVFVGKGLTFDSGGISIKPGASMEDMKYDMCGGANVIGAIIAIAKLKLKLNVICLVPAAENMPSGRSTKPGDIHTARNGKTFEVNNTDAEGRLILSDALSYASELQPQVIVDAATLTGAIAVALGNTHTGYFSRNEALVKRIETASKSSGELVWRMPLIDHHVKDMKGSYADLSNISSGKGGGSSTAAAFLEQFVSDGIPWAHFDIAGTAWAIGNRVSYNPKKGASGVMIRTFIELAKSYV